MPLCSNRGALLCAPNTEMCPQTIPTTPPNGRPNLDIQQCPVYFPSVHSLQVPRRGDPVFLSSVFSSGRHKAEDEDATVINDNAGGTRHTGMA